MSKCTWEVAFRNPEEKDRYMDMLDAIAAAQGWSSRSAVMRRLIEDAYYDLESENTETERFLAELRRAVPEVFEKYPNTLKLLENS